MFTVWIKNFPAEILQQHRDTHASSLTFKLIFRYRNTGLRNSQNVKNLFLHWNMKFWKLLT